MRAAAKLGPIQLVPSSYHSSTGRYTDAYTARHPFHSDFHSLNGIFPAETMFGMITDIDRHWLWFCLCMLLLPLLMKKQIYVFVSYRFRTSLEGYNVAANRDSADWKKGRGSLLDAAQLISTVDAARKNSKIDISDGNTVGEDDLGMNRLHGDLVAKSSMEHKSDPPHPPPPAPSLYHSESPDSSMPPSPPPSPSSADIMSPIIASSDGSGSDTRQPTKSSSNPTSQANQETPSKNQILPSSVPYRAPRSPKPSAKVPAVQNRSQPPPRYNSIKPAKTNHDASRSRHRPNQNRAHSAYHHNFPSLPAVPHNPPRQNNPPRHNPHFSSSKRHNNMHDKHVTSSSIPSPPSSPPLPSPEPPCDPPLQSISPAVERSSRPRSPSFLTKLTPETDEIYITPSSSASTQAKHHTDSSSPSSPTIPTSTIATVAPETGVPQWTPFSSRVNLISTPLVPPPGLAAPVSTQFFLPRFDMDTTARSNARSGQIQLSLGTSVVPAMQSVAHDMKVIRKRGGLYGSFQ